MDVVCSFGRSVDVDGDEWIDLGLPPTPREREDDGLELASPTRDIVRTADTDDKHPFAASGETSNKPVTAAVATPQPVPEPEPVNDTQRKPVAAKLAHAPKVKAIPERKKPSQAPPAPVVKSKAAKSKEALMAFYLGRAKQMEAKHHNMVVSSANSAVILERSAPIGL